MSERPYSRVYHSIVDDPKFADIYDDDRRLATWLRLLIGAEQAHPASATVPLGTHRPSLLALVTAGLIDLGTGSRYRVHGLDAERSRRSEAARVGGLASGRSRSVEHSLNGRSTESNLDETSIDETRRASRDVEPKKDAARPGSSTVDRNPLFREMREAIVERYGHGMDEPSVQPLPVRRGR